MAQASTASLKAEGKSSGAGTGDRSSELSLLQARCRDAEKKNAALADSWWDRILCYQSSRLLLNLQ